MKMKQCVAFGLLDVWKVKASTRIQRKLMFRFLQRVVTVRKTFVVVNTTSKGAEINANSKTLEVLL